MYSFELNKICVENRKIIFRYLNIKKFYKKGSSKKRTIFIKFVLKIEKLFLVIFYKREILLKTGNY